MARTSKNKGLSPNTRNITTAVLLILTPFFPIAGIIGLILTWVWTTWSKKVKIIITVIMVLLCFISFLFTYKLLSAFDRVQKTTSDPKFASSRPATGISDIEIGDRIIYSISEETGEQSVKQVLGLPRDTIRITDGYVYIRGSKTKLTETRYSLPKQGTHGSTIMREEGEIVIPENTFFLVGRKDSDNSEFVETDFVEYGNIVGIVTKARYRHTKN